MEEKGIETHKNQSTNKSNSNLYLFDDAYHKVKEQQKSLRCKSANIHKKISFNTNNIKNNLTKRIDINDNKRKNIIFFKRPNFFSNELLRKENNNTIDLQVMSTKSRNKLNSNIKTINLSNLIKSNDSIKLDTTKQTSKRTRILSGKYNSSYSFNKLSNSARNVNKKLFRQKNNNQFSIINLNVNSCTKDEKAMNKTTLKDIAIKNLIKKSKTKKFEKIIKSRNNRTNRENVNFLDFYSSPNSFYLKNEKKYNIDYNYLINNDESKDSEKNININYPIKYSFWDDTISNIYHMVNFIDIENKEELFQNVRIDFKNKNEIKFEDFKTFGHEFSPEILYRINQDEKQRLIKIQLEELKKKNKKDNTNDIKKIQRPIFKKHYIPEFKQKFKNQDWKNKQYESIYKFHAIKYIEPKKTSIIKKKLINQKFVPKNLEKHNSLIYRPKESKLPQNLRKETKKEKKNYSFKFDVIENKKIKSALKKNNRNQNSEDDYIDTSQEVKTNKNNKEETSEDKKQSGNINNKIAKNNEKNIKNDIKDNSYNFTSSLNNSSSNRNINIHSQYKIINQKQYHKDYNKINKIVRAENIVLRSDNNYKYEKLDISDYVNRINSTRKYHKRNSFNALHDIEFISSTKNKTKKSLTNIINSSRNKKHKTFLHRKSAKISFSKMLNEQNSIFKSNEDSKTNDININNEAEKIEETEKNKKEEEKIIPLIKDINMKKDEVKKEVKNEIKKEIKMQSNIQKDKNLEEAKNDEKLQKNLLTKIEKENRQHEEHKIQYKPFYRNQREISNEYNKIEINFIGNQSKFVNKRKLRKKSRINVKEITNKIPKQKDDLLYKKEPDNEEKKEEDMVQKLEEQLSKIQRRRMNKSATLEYINRKYKEIERKKGIVDINEELTENLDKLKFFKTMDLESVEDIEYHKNVLLYKLKEDIRYKIAIGQCDKTEMEEYFKFENKLNEYKINYNLKDKDKIREYVLLLLVKFNEFIELLNIREERKNEENRINKFINNLNYDLDYNIPLSLMVKGRKCFSRNYNQDASALSEIKK